MDYSGARGTLIHEKKLRSKILCQTPFKGIWQWGWFFEDFCINRFSIGPISSHSVCVCYQSRCFHIGWFSSVFPTLNTTFYYLRFLEYEVIHEAMYEGFYSTRCRSYASGQCSLKKNLEYYWCLQRTDLQICSSLGYEFWSKNKERNPHLFCRWHWHTPTPPFPCRTWPESGMVG